MSYCLDAMDEYTQHLQSDLDKCNARIAELTDLIKCYELTGSDESYKRMIESINP